MTLILDRCAVDGCEQPRRKRTWCSLHYTRIWRNGQPGTVEPTRVFADVHTRLWLRIDKHGPTSAYRPDLGRCWLWMGALTDGYGEIAITAGVPAYTHRLVYEELVGPIPDVLDLDHLCRVRHCCNPAHLEPVTRAENNRRGAQARRNA